MADFSKHCPARLSDSLAIVASLSGELEARLGDQHPALRQNWGGPPNCLSPTQSISYPRQFPSSCQRTQAYVPGTNRATEQHSTDKKTKKPDTFESVRLGIWSRRQESNLDLSLRRAEFYPLKYSEESGLRQNRSLALSPIRRRFLLHLLRFRCPPGSSAQSPGRPGRRGRCAGRWAPGRRRWGRAASSG